MKSRLRKTRDLKNGKSKTLTRKRTLKTAMFNWHQDSDSDEDFALKIVKKRPNTKDHDA